MQIFKNKAFSRWAAREGLNDRQLRAAVMEIEQGLLDADLGGHVVKKRVALAGRGKSGSVRTILVYWAHNKAFFVYGFAKNVRTNIKPGELKALKRYASELLSYDDKTLRVALKAGELIEVTGHG